MRIIIKVICRLRDAERLTLEPADDVLDALAKAEAWRERLPESECEIAVELVVAPAWTRRRVD